MHVKKKSLNSLICLLSAKHSYLWQQQCRMAATVQNEKNQKSVSI